MTGQPIITREVTDNDTPACLRETQARVVNIDELIKQLSQGTEQQLEQVREYTDQAVNSVRAQDSAGLQPNADAVMKELGRRRAEKPLPATTGTRPTGGSSFHTLSGDAATMRADPEDPSNSSSSEESDGPGGSDGDGLSPSVGKRFADDAQEFKDAVEMMALKYNGDISAYLTRMQELNRTVQWSGVSFQTYIRCNIPVKITELMYARHGKIPKDDKKFLEAVREAGLFYESTRAIKALSKKVQSTMTKHQSASDRQEEQLSASSSSNPPSGTNVQGTASTKSTKDQVWRSNKEALQGIAQADIDKRKKANVSCWRCGRNTHGTLNCYAKRDIDKKDLPPPPDKAPKAAGVKRKLQDTVENAETANDEEQPAYKIARMGPVSIKTEEPTSSELSDKRPLRHRDGFAPSRPTGAAQLAGVAGPGTKRTAEDDEEQPGKSPPPPRSGPRAIVPMTVICNREGRLREHPIKVLMGSGSIYPILSPNVVKILGIRQYAHDSPVRLIAPSEYGLPEEATMYTGPVVLRHGDSHFSRVKFQVSPMDPEFDSILTWAWICTHKPAGLFEGDPSEITFPNPDCLRNCTSLKVLGMPGMVPGTVAAE